MSLVAVGDVHESAEGAVGVADGERPADEQHAGPGPVAGMGVDDADPLAAGDVAQLEAAAGGRRGSRRRHGRPSPTGRRAAPRRREAARHGRRGTRRTRPSSWSTTSATNGAVQELLEQRALIDLVDHLRRPGCPRRPGGGWRRKRCALRNSQPARSSRLWVSRPRWHALYLRPDPHGHGSLRRAVGRGRCVAKPSTSSHSSSASLRLVILVVVVGRADAGLDQQPQGADGVATVGAEPGEVDECRPVAAPAVDGGLQHVDGRGRVARAVEQPGPQPDRTDRGRIGHRQHAGEPRRDRRASPLGGRARSTPPPRRRRRRAHPRSRPPRRAHRRRRSRCRRRRGAQPRRPPGLCRGRRRW